MFAVRKGIMNVLRREGPLFSQGLPSWDPAKAFIKGEEKNPGKEK